MVPTYSLLTLAVLALWAGGGVTAHPLRRYLWLLCFGGALIAALVAGIVQPVGLVWVGGFAWAAHAFSTAPAGSRARALAGSAIIVLAAGLMTHQLPGFNNPRVIDSVRLTPDALPYRLHLNFDKTIVGLFLLGFCHARLASVAEAGRTLRLAAPVIGVLLAVLLAASLIAGYVRFDPKYPAEAPLFLWANLCLTCLAEEALFRGIVQRGLQERWASQPQGKWFALGIASLLFGVAHAAGGPVYVVLSTVAGAGYGWAYLRTGRIEASILTHFTLNAVHFLGFTYPALARVS